MKIVQITPGAGGMYCGNCFRDNALVAALRRAGHDAVMLPLYLPMTLEEPEESRGTPIFFGGINVYLESKASIFRRSPGWLHRWLASPRLLQWAAGRAAKTEPKDVGALTLSMLRGEQGDQARELEELIGHLNRPQMRPDVVCLSNALLSGLLREIQHQAGVPVVCMLQGEAPFLDSLPDPFRQQAWSLTAERASEAAALVAPSRYAAGQMSSRLALAPERIRVVPNGIPLDGYVPAPQPPQEPVLGFFARMCKDKGLDLLVDAFIRLKEKGTVPNLRLKVGGGLSASDEPFVQGLKKKLMARNLTAEFYPNLSRDQKIGFLQSLTLFSVPALYGEAFGLYLLEAMAAGVPVVQPRHGAFPELIQATGGGVIADPNAESLAASMEELLLAPDKLRTHARQGREAVVRAYSVECMARGMAAVFEEACGARAVG